MKKLGSLLLILALFVGLAGNAAFAAGDPLPSAAPIFDHARFEKYAAYQYDTLSGDWSVYANEVISALDLLVDQGGRSSEGVSYFFLEITGNAMTGLLTPVLNVYYTGKNAVNATAVSFVIGAERYDFAVGAQDVNIGGRAASLMRIPLDDGGLTMLQKMSAVQSANLRIHGDEQYSALIKPAATYKSAKEQVEALSLASLPPMLRELHAIGVDRYKLWDLNAMRWAHATGVIPRMQLTPIETVRSQNGIELDATFNMLSPGLRNNKSVTALQEQLVKLYYLTGKADGTFGASTRTAVRNIQRLIGDIPTGSVDRALLARLFGGAIEPAPESASQADPQWAQLDDAALVVLSRYWFAPSVTASKGDLSLARRSASNQDNILIVFDGLVKNQGLQTLDLTWRLSGTVTYDGQYDFPCTLVCERDEGTGFGDTLIPLAQSRLVIYAEVPRNLAEASGPWLLTLKAGESKLEFPLAAPDLIVNGAG